MHLGTLAAAVASFLHARRARGRWLVRIEDIDPPREVPGSAVNILRCLEALEMHWDGEVRYQSANFDSYRRAAEQLLARNLAYYCNCSRQAIRSLSGTARYPGTCRERFRGPADAAIRIKTTGEPIDFVDGVQGSVAYAIEPEEGDFVIMRRDKLPAYHLAVVLDDAEQGITDIVRGSDLLLSTPLHIHLQRALSLPEPRYWHIPLIRNAHGEKLSKSAGARPVDTRRPELTAARVLHLLGQEPPATLAGAPPGVLWDWAAESFQLPAPDHREIARTDTD
jgi:glutamyl-Q tRNA(Asp) synthetase